MEESEALKKIKEAEQRLIEQFGDYKKAPWYRYYQEHDEKREGNTSL